MPAAHDSSRFMLPAPSTCLSPPGGEQVPPPPGTPRADSWGVSMSTAATTAKHGAQRCPRAGLGARHLALHPPAEGTLCHHPLLLLPPSPPLLRAPGCLGPSSGDISKVGARIRCDPRTHGDPRMGVPVGCGCPGWMCPHPVAGCGIGGCLGVRVPRVGVRGGGGARAGGVGEWQGRVWPLPSPRSGEQRAAPWHAAAIPGATGASRKSSGSLFLGTL